MRCKLAMWRAAAASKLIAWSMSIVHPVLVLALQPDTRLPKINVESIATQSAISNRL